MKELLISIASLFVGFVSSRISDYYWLKSPKLNLNTSPSFKYVQQGLNGPFYQADCTAYIHNYSKNEAYGLEVIEIVFCDPSVIVQEESLSVMHKPITDTDPLEVKFSCTIPIIIPEGKTSFNDNLSDQNFLHSFVIKCSFQNQLGRKYIKLLSGKFDKEHRSKFFTFGFD